MTENITPPGWESPLAVAAQRKPGLRGWQIALIVLGSLLLAAILVGLIVGPNLNRVRMQTNETAAINSLKAIHQAELLYQNQFPKQGYACRLGDLGSDPTASEPSVTSARLLPPDLANGRKNGYAFNIACAYSNDDRNPVASYHLTAIPESVGSTGRRGFCMTENGDLTVDAEGGTNCTSPLE